MTRNSAFFKKNVNIAACFPTPQSPTFRSHLAFRYISFYHPFFSFPHPARFFFPTVPLSFRITPRLPIRAFPPFPSLLLDSLFFVHTLHSLPDTSAKNFNLLESDSLSHFDKRTPFLSLSSSSYYSEKCLTNSRSRLGLLTVAWNLAFRRAATSLSQIALLSASRVSTYATDRNLPNLPLRSRSPTAKSSASAASKPSACGTNLSPTTKQSASPGRTGVAPP